MVVTMYAQGAVHYVDVHERDAQGPTSADIKKARLHKSVCYGKCRQRGREDWPDGEQRRSPTDVDQDNRKIIRDKQQTVIYMYGIVSLGLPTGQQSNGTRKGHAAI